MDSTAPQTAAIIREGEPSKSRSKNTDVKVDAADPADVNDNKTKDSSKVLDKKNTKKQAKGSKVKNEKPKPKKKKKKSKSVAVDDSSDSADTGDESSDATSDGVKLGIVSAKKDSTKKGIDVNRVGRWKPKKETKKKGKESSSAKTSQSTDSESDVDSSESEDESEDEGDEKNGESDVNKSKEKSMDSDVSHLVAKELQRLLQLVGSQGPPPQLSPGHVGNLGTLGFGLAPVFGGGLAVGNYPQAGQGIYANPAAGQGQLGLIQPSGSVGSTDPPKSADPLPEKRTSSKATDQGEQKSKKLDYKRVDHIWDTSIHNFKLQDTAKSTSEVKYDGFCFHVRRTFDWEGKYKATIVDVKSKILRECLQDVLGDIKGVSLVDETPRLDPNVLFLYLEDLRKHVRTLKKAVANPPGTDKQERKKQAKHLEEKRQHLKVLVKYIDKDYEHIKKSLYPMLEHGLITFDLLWALWKPNTLAYTATYGSHDEPRVFKVDLAEKHYHLSKGDYYYIDGRYFEYDGKQFGYGRMVEEVAEFRGAKKITSLPCYPLQYHKQQDKVRKDLIERGKKFVALSGVHYKSHHGLAYYKKKKSIVKVNVDGRVIIDSAIHRRINPNYPISIVRPKENDLLTDEEDSDDDDLGEDSDDEDAGQDQELEESENKEKHVTKFLKDEKTGKIQIVRMTKEEAEELDKERLTRVDGQTDDEIESGDDETEGSEGQDAKKLPQFTDEEYLVASPVVLGFSFGEKLWLEFTVSGIKDISWNENAYESLVLEPKTKETVKALVESHKYHAAESIDDVIQGKGKGLVAVLHGPPGTGKTLTAEGISELLKCPLYMVSAGELGTDSRILEAELQRILDICHAWGAILLLDEADVFLEKRNMHDIHRNALVSIFLRQLEYFQGILFLTTNRVETFDDAFQSRIHIALRYDALDQRAKKAIFKMFVDRARAQQKADQTEISFTDKDYDSLARHDLNGRQIKNTVIRAQALAVNKGEPLAMKHVRQILDVQVSFDRDLKGGTGYQDAMRSYF